MQPVKKIISGRQFISACSALSRYKLSKLVLVAEDEPLILEPLQFLLEQSGLRVITATDGMQAIRSIQELHPDLVILDVKMQHHSGFEVLKMIRADPTLGETKVLILTAMRLKEEYRIAIELGADKYITKPFSNKDLVADVNELLGLT